MKWIFITSFIQTEWWSNASVFERVYLNPIAIRKAKIVYNFGLSKCNYPYVLTDIHVLLKSGATFCNPTILILKLYNSLVASCNNGKTNWAKGVKTLLNNYGFSYVWSNPF